MFKNSWFSFLASSDVNGKHNMMRNVFSL
jgi:hypothetical protein